MWSQTRSLSTKWNTEFFLQVIFLSSTRRKSRLPLLPVWSMDQHPWYHLGPDELESALSRLSRGLGMYSEVCEILIIMASIWFIPKQGVPSMGGEVNKISIQTMETGVNELSHSRVLGAACTRFASTTSIAPIASSGLLLLGRSDSEAHIYTAGEAAVLRPGFASLDYQYPDSRTLLWVAAGCWAVTWPQMFLPDREKIFTRLWVSGNCPILLKCCHS